jgi:hypothetical protein
LFVSWLERRDENFWKVGGENFWRIQKNTATFVAWIL